MHNQQKQLHSVNSTQFTVLLILYQDSQPTGLSFDACHKFHLHSDNTPVVYMWPYYHYNYVPNVKWISTYLFHTHAQ